MGLPMPTENEPRAPLTVDMPGVVVVSEMNAREHWTVKNGRKRRQQFAAGVYLSQVPAGAKAALLAAPGVRVRFARYGGRRMDTDNLCSAFKHVRDRVAAWLGRDDGDPWFVWELPPAQRPGGPAGVSVTLEVVG